MILRILVFIPLAGILAIVGAAYGWKPMVGNGFALIGIAAAWIITGIPRYLRARREQSSHDETRR